MLGIQGKFVQFPPLPNFEGVVSKYFAKPETLFNHCFNSGPTSSADSTAKFDR
jgi:hypothetical protein